MRIEPFLLLCESCGYPIGELPREGHCPECGRPIAESLPQRRAGSAWQQDPSIGAWFRTIGWVIRRPRAMWAQVRVEAPASGDLLTLNCGLAATGLALYSAPFLMLGTSRLGILDPRIVVGLLGTFCLVAFFGAMALMALSFVECGGIRFFGGRRRWRITHEVGMAVIGHASFGWLLAPITLPVCWSIASAGLLGALNGAQGPGPIASAVTVAAMLAGPLIPLLAFEGLVYLGVRRMRFANVGE